ncbi:MAG: L,D-transpeptidase [Nitrospirota bacterium]|nr:L,D-transpeptidase [Nitrospirota bacterium]MDE3118048.1 L,D-transpeptidase [Nitrospirota bacterium]MDE3243170.1 L,D-transpeptidase [Nitrospirota bacterium]
MAHLAKTMAAAFACAGSLVLAASHGGELPEAGNGAAMRDQPVRRSGDSLEALRARQAALKRQLAQLAPEGHYIVVDTARNKLQVKRRDQVILDAVASTGSGTILDAPGKPGIRWVFDTPRGEFKVQSRLTNPVWVKPDWAFLEEGLGVPTDPAERLEPGTLGDYALGFGKGYFIHGTLYRRLLGKNVTHGCIRLSDEDLRTVYQLSKIGTSVMIF